MRVLLSMVLALSATCGCRTPSTASADQPPSIDDSLRAYGQITITCTPQWYRRVGDSALVSADRALSEGHFNADGVVLRIQSPTSFHGMVLSFHFDFPEEWNHWYKPGVTYTGPVATNIIGRMNFLCDPGLRATALRIEPVEKP